jgi:hypothetical protein
MLELGCATGEFMRVARRKGLERAIGIEPSAYCRKIARSDGLDVREPSEPGLSAAIAALTPNLVVAWDVWEHLPAPATTLEQTLGMASDDAFVAITTVDASSAVARFRRDRWRQFHPPTHLHFPTRRSFEVLFGRLGMRVRLHRAFGYYRPLREYLRVLGIRPRATARWADLPIYFNLFDTQLIIAQRSSHAGGQG